MTNTFSFLKKYCSEIHKSVPLIAFLFLANSVFAQNGQTIDLYEWQTAGKLSIVNREVKTIDSSGTRFIRLSETPRDGIVWLPVGSFKNGVIELEMRGKDLFQKSFIGIVFHGQNDSSYDAVYCRPFNFLAKDSVRRIHAIQYISHPIYTWKKLREEQNSLFEKEILFPPDPNGWFKMKLVLNNQLIEAFINDAKVPSLSVQKIAGNEGGRIGIFMGDSSGGDFKTFSVRYAK